MKTLFLFEKLIDFPNDMLEKFNVENSQSPELSFNEFKFSHCALFLNFGSGVSKSQIDIIKRNSQIGHWLVVLVKHSSDAQENIKPYENIFKSELTSLDITLNVIDYVQSGDNCKILDWLEQQKEIATIVSDFIDDDNLTDKQKKICLVSLLSSTINKGLIEKIFTEIFGQYNLIIQKYENSETANSIQKAAHKIFFVGDDIDSFYLKPIDGGVKRATFILDNMEKNPIYYIESELTKKKIINALNKCGWDIPVASLNSIFIGSSTYYINRDSKEINPEKFILFDMFGLPLPHSMYKNANLTSIKNELMNLTKI